jgi:endonuclease/exonuclease/phosphatase family metal-dependent hydrolase
MKNSYLQNPQSHQQLMPGGKIPLLTTLLVLFLAFILPASAQRPDVGGKRGVDVFTVNLYVGGDLGRVMALNPADTNYVEELVGTVTGVYYEILASAPQVRLQTVADEIAARHPDIVAVEEASLLRIQSPGDLIVGGTTPATTVVFDYLEMLVTILKAQGLNYIVVSTAYEGDVELPMFNLQTGQIDDARLTDREAILVRADLPPGQLHVSHPQSGHFANAIPIPALGSALQRGWCAVDVTVRGRNFRCICAHTEEEIAPQIQALQVQELLAGPANVKSPVIILGDFNADPLHRDGSFAYNLIPSAGFIDAWTALHPAEPAGGLTWGHDEFLADPATLFGRRIDFVFYRGATFVPVKAEVDNLNTSMPLPPLWGSDHAAVTAEFQLR